MGFFDRLFNRAPEPTVTRRPVPGLAGGMTAHQAWAVAAPAAKALDPRARLTLITSGTDMNREGRSRSWEFSFYLPGRNATAMIGLAPDPHGADVDSADCTLTQRVRRGGPLDASRPAFPELFRDSPEVVAEFSANGVDFVAGPTDMKLEGHMLASGEALWVTYYWDQEHMTPFQAKDHTA